MEHKTYREMREIWRALDNEYLERNKIDFAKKDNPNLFRQIANIIKTIRNNADDSDFLCKRHALEEYLYRLELECNTRNIPSEDIRRNVILAYLSLQPFFGDDSLACLE